MADKYTYRVVWSEEDEEFVGLCAEFPSLSWLDADQVEAFKGICKLVADTVEDMHKHGEKVPEPLALKKYTGRYPLRMEPQLHRKLDIEAAEKNMSLNRLLNAKLAEAT